MGATAGRLGTQLTMRTVHTGGVFRGSGAARTIDSPLEGVIKAPKMKTREFRTRHGEVVQLLNKEIDAVVESAKGRTVEVHIPANAKVMFKDGDSVTKGQRLAEFEPTSAGDGSRLTEKAYKDITSDISGEVLFEDFTAEARPSTRA